MAVDSTHPLYDLHLPDWRQMRDTFKGQREVKEQGTKYLPPTSGMIADGMSATGTMTNTATNTTTITGSGAGSPGLQAFKAYLLRSVFPDLVKEAVKAMLGVMHNKPATIEVPDAMEPLLDNLTIRNEDAQMLLRRIHQEQLVSGRVGLLVDLPEGETRGSLPYIALYQAEQMINWDKGRRDGIEIETLNLVVLDESEYERQNTFDWKEVKKYRVLLLGEADTNEEANSGAVYSVGVYRQDDGGTFVESDQVVPSFGGTTLQEIPFTFINAVDVVPEPENPPLLGLSDISLTIYRGEADYRQALFMQGQDTLVTIGMGETEELRTGANASINLPMEGDAKYIGVDSSGLSEQREALQNDYTRASQKGGEMLDNVSRQKESGDALKIRVAARTATLHEVTLAGAYGLETALKQIAVWMGLNPDDVLVTPNQDFVDEDMSGKELTEIMTAKTMGAPLSQKSIHKNMQDRGMTEETYEDELIEIGKEPALGLMAEDPNDPDPNDAGNSGNSNDGGDT